jgi:hypothetical protein
MHSHHELSEFFTNLRIYTLHHEGMRRNAAAGPIWSFLDTLTADAGIER